MKFTLEAIIVVSTLFALLLAVEGRPQRPRQRQQQREELRQRQQQREQQGSEEESTSARRPSTLFVRPEFDALGRPLDFVSEVDEEAIIREGGKNSNRRAGTNRGGRGGRARQRRPAFSELIDFVEEEDDLNQEDDDSRLPTFGHPDTVLKATKELRDRDRNQDTFIALGNSHAGLLPLRGEDIGSLNLFPPLRAAQRLPRK